MKNTCKKIKLNDGIWSVWTNEGDLLFESDSKQRIEEFLDYVDNVRSCRTIRSKQFFCWVWSKSK